MGIQEIQIWGVRAIMNQQFLQFAKTIGGRRSKGASVQSYLIYTILINSQKAMWGNIYQGKNFKNPWYILTIEVGIPPMRRMSYKRYQHTFVGARGAGGGARLVATAGAERGSTAGRTGKGSTVTAN